MLELNRMRSPSLGSRSRTRLTHRHRADAGHDLALGQMPVPHEPLVAIIGQLVGMVAE